MSSRCEELWFPDGSLVVRADKTVFRVYRGMLATASPVFSDMLSFPQPDGAETVEGCPVVILHDSATDLRHFLGVLNDYTYYDKFCKSDPFILYSLLRLATKYDVTPLRERVLAFFTDIFPASLNVFAWDTACLSRPNYVRRADGADELDILGVKAGRELDVPQILPAALLRCTLAPLSLITRGVTVDDGRHIELDTPDKLLCIEAREKLAARFADTLSRWTLEAPDDHLWPTGCVEDWCRSAPGALATTVLGSDPERPSRLFASWVPRGGAFLAVEEQFFSSECDYGCESAWRDRYQDLRDAIWDDVPALYGFDSWRAVIATGKPAA